MLKIVVLQKFYGLSEERTKFDIMDRYIFMRVLQVAPGNDLREKNTIWDFKEKLGIEGVARLFWLLDESLHADSAYRGKAIMAELRRRKIKALICQKGKKGTP